MELKEKVKKSKEFVLTEDSRKSFWSVLVQTNALYMYSSCNYCLTSRHVLTSCHNSRGR